MVEGEGKKIIAVPASVDAQYSDADTDRERDTDRGTGVIEESSSRIGVSWTGRTDTNKRVVFPASSLTSPVLTGLSREEAEQFASLILKGERGGADLGPGLESVAALVQQIEHSRERHGEGISIRGDIDRQDEAEVESVVGAVEKGSYVVVKIIAARGHTLR